MRGNSNHRQIDEVFRLIDEEVEWILADIRVDIITAVMPKQRVPDWPDVESLLLSSFLDALRKRSRAIKYRTQVWICEVTHNDESNGQEAVTTEMFLTNPRVKVKLWDDGVLWFYVRDFRARVWLFEFSFYVQISPGQCEQIVQTIEDSFTPVCIRESSELTKQHLLSLWQQFSPFEIDYGRA